MGHDQVGQFPTAEVLGPMAKVRAVPHRTVEALADRAEDAVDLVARHRVSFNNSFCYVSIAKLAKRFGNKSPGKSFPTKAFVKATAALRPLPD